MNKINLTIIGFFTILVIMLRMTNSDQDFQMIIYTSIKILKKFVIIYICLWITKI